MTSSNDEHIADISRAATAPNDEIVADPTPVPETGTGDPDGPSSASRPSDELDPSDEFLVEPPIEDEPAGGGSLA